MPSSVKFREAYARGVPLVHYDRFGHGAAAYREAARLTRSAPERAYLLDRASRLT